MLERIKFIKVNRNKQYHYTPRYYDERKERLNQLKTRYQENSTDEEIDSITYRERMKQRIEQSWEMNGSSGSAARSANIRLILILVALLAGTYFLLDYVELFSADITVID
jgi:hypothetical protein